jgi:hypothetical protein
MTIFKTEIGEWELMGMTTLGSGSALNFNMFNLYSQNLCPWSLRMTCHWYSHANTASYIGNEMISKNVLRLFSCNEYDNNIIIIGFRS